MSTAELLERALTLIERPECWTRNALARDRDGAATFPCSDDAVSFCALGAVIAAERHGPLSLNKPAAGALRQALPLRSLNVATFNNAAAHADVVALFQRAIRSAHEREAVPVAGLPGRADREVTVTPAEEERHPTAGVSAS